MFKRLKVVFLDELPLADVSTVFEKGENVDKENCRPVSILPQMSRVFESIF